MVVIMLMIVWRAILWMESMVQGEKMYVGVGTKVIITVLSMHVNVIHISRVAIV